MEERGHSSIRLRSTGYESCDARRHLPLVDETKLGRLRYGWRKPYKLSHIYLCREHEDGDAGNSPVYPQSETRSWCSNTTHFTRARQLQIKFILWTFTSNHWDLKLRGVGSKTENIVKMIEWTQLRSKWINSFDCSCFWRSSKVLLICDPYAMEAKFEYIGELSSLEYVSFSQSKIYYGSCIVCTAQILKNIS